MQLERLGEDSLAVVGGGIRRLVTGARVRSYEDAMPDFSGDRAYWSEAALHVIEGGRLVVTVVDVTDHEGGTSRRARSFASVDDGRTWSETQDAPARDPDARLSTHYSTLERVAEHRLIRPLSDDRFGALWEASSPNGERVALRLLGADDAAYARLDAVLARLVAVLHPHLLRVRTFGRAHDARFYIVTDPIPSGSLADAIARARFGPERASELARQMLDGLAALHEAGLVHGDVRPVNVRLADGANGVGRAMLVDASLLAALEDPRGTRGTLRTDYGYAAPETVRERRVEVASDLYGAGATLHALLSGHPPFVSEMPHLAIAILRDAPEPPANAPPALAAVVARALSKAPTDRYPTAAEMRYAL